MTIVIGIDPGLSGAIAIVAPDGSARVWDTPSVVVKGSRRDYLTAGMRRLLADARELHGPLVAVLEDGIAMPRQSSRTTAVQFRGIGIWEGLLAGLSIPYERVPPARWKRDMGLIGCDKGASRAKAQQLFPVLGPELSRVRDDGRAEALLIAEWRRRRG